MVIRSLLSTPVRTREGLATEGRTLVPVNAEQADDVGDETVNVRVVGVGAMKPESIFGDDRIELSNNGVSMYCEVASV